MFFHGRIDVKVETRIFAQVHNIFGPPQGIHSEWGSTGSPHGFKKLPKASSGDKLYIFKLLINRKAAVTCVSFSAVSLLFMHRPLGVSQFGTIWRFQEADVEGVCERIRLLLLKWGGRATGSPGRPPSHPPAAIPPGHQPPTRPTVRLPASLLPARLTANLLPADFPMPARPSARPPACPPVARPSAPQALEQSRSSFSQSVPAGSCRVFSKATFWFLQALELCSRSTAGRGRPQSAS